MQNEEQGRSLKSEMSLESSERPVWIESREGQLEEQCAREKVLQGWEGRQEDFLHFNLRAMEP